MKILSRDAAEELHAQVSTLMQTLDKLRAFSLENDSPLMQRCVEQVMPQARELFGIAAKETLYSGHSLVASEGGFRVERVEIESESK